MNRAIRNIHAVLGRDRGVLVAIRGIDPEGWPTSDWIEGPVADLRLSGDTFVFFWIDLDGGNERMHGHHVRRVHHSRRDDCWYVEVWNADFRYRIRLLQTAVDREKVAAWLRLPRDLPAMDEMFAGLERRAKALGPPPSRRRPTPGASGRPTYSPEDENA